MATHCFDAVVSHVHWVYCAYILLHISPPGLSPASLLIDALLGSGAAGPLREPVSSAVDLLNAIVTHARAAGRPCRVLAIDTPTRIDLTDGTRSDPVVAADLTVTFHRPKTGLLTRRGAALAGKVLVAPIGIPPGADRG